MKPTKISFLLLLFLTLISCKKDESLQNYLSKSWQTSYLKIKMNTHNNTDSTHVYEDRFLNNPEIIAQSTYNKDGTFSAWYSNKDAEKQSETSGKWFVKGDSLMISYTIDNKQTKVSYFITRTDEGFKAESINDWDDDGKKDDYLLMKTKQIRID